MKEASIEFKKILSLKEDDFEKYVNERRIEIVSFHLANNSFYQNLSPELKNTFTLESWNKLPILTKANYQKPLIERLSTSYTLKNVYVNRTSGSSGDPFIFAKDKFCHAMVWSSIKYRFGMYGINLNTSYQARFYGYPLEFIGKYKLIVKDFLSSRYRFRIFDLSDASIKKFVTLFKSKKFDYINGYTSCIVMMCNYLKKENLILKNICPSLKVCIVTSEMLFEDDKKLLEEWLGIPVVNEYGAAEMDIIAFQNTNDEWLINTESLYVEILDDDNQPLPFGEEGNIVVTSLYNKAHPFIRYKIGDIGVLEKITDKKIILKKLIGRTNDFATLPSGKKAPGMTFYSLTKVLMQEDGNLKEFVIKQTNLSTFEIIYVSDKVLSEKQETFMKQKFSDYLEDGLTFNFIRKEKLERSKSGKLKQFVSLVK
ncbi:phenylacetate--CoA ligase family protein [Flavobacterium sp.]